MRPAGLVERQQDSLLFRRSAAEVLDRHTEPMQRVQGPIPDRAFLVGVSAVGGSFLARGRFVRGIVGFVSIIRCQCHASTIPFCNASRTLVSRAAVLKGLASR